MDLFSAGAAFVITSTMLFIPRFRRWYFGVFELDKKLEIKKPVEDGTVRWRVNGYGAYCFKCTMWTKNDPSPVGPLCDCPEYEKPHFHFRCGACGFKTIMRTADDRRAEDAA
jgi:hypothetical protein